MMQLQSRRTWRCPDETRLATYVDGQMEPASRQGLESHLAKCDHCLGQVGFLLRAQDLPEVEAPPALIARAKDLAARPGYRRHPIFQWGAVAAAAACLVVAANLWVRPPEPDARNVAVPAPKVAVPATSPAPTPIPTPPQRTVRGGPLVAAPEPVLPRPDSTIARQDLEFRWKEIPGSLFYEVRVVAADGDVLWEAKAQGTAIRPPGNVPLAAGQKYFVWIRAHLPEGKALQSRASAFTIKNE